MKQNAFASLSFITMLATLGASVEARAVEGEASGYAVAPAGRAVGFGVELGAPTELNLKLMTGANQGVVLGLGGGIWYDASVSFHADYVVHPLVGEFNGGAFSAYVGGGGWASLGFPGAHYGYYQPYYAPAVEPLAFGARVPLGLNLAFNALPFELFVEVVPALEIFPAIGVFGQGGLGARVYF